MPKVTKERSRTLYDRDFFAWTKQVADALRSDSVDRADVEHIAEEIEDMGKRDRRELFSRTRVLLTHLIKWDIQPDRQCNSWLATIAEQRIQIRQLLEDSPSLRHEASYRLQTIWVEAQIAASRETNLRVGIDPDCPFEFERIISEQFLLNHFEPGRPSPKARKNPLRKIWNKFKEY
jgi:hypothetical protein